MADTDATRDATAVRDAILDFAKPNAGLGWDGLPIDEGVADELAAFLWERGLLREDIR